MPPIYHTRPPGGQVNNTYSYQTWRASPARPVAALQNSGDLWASVQKPGRVLSNAAQSGWLFGSVGQEWDTFAATRTTMGAGSTRNRLTQVTSFDPAGDGSLPCETSGWQQPGTKAA